VGFLFVAATAGHDPACIQGGRVPTSLRHNLTSTAAGALLRVVVAGAVLETVCLPRRARNRTAS